MMNSGMLERDVLLCRIVASLVHIRGRKRFQKSMYLAKALGYPVPEEFAWGNYGVYSSELQWEIDSMVKEGLLVEQNLSKAGEDPEYDYSIGNGGRTLLEKAMQLATRNEAAEPSLSEEADPISTVGNNEMDALIDFLRRLNTKSVRDLELWSSILYLKPSERNEATMIAFLRYLKPQYSEGDIRKGMKEVDALMTISFAAVRDAHRGGLPKR